MTSRYIAFARAYERIHAALRREVELARTPDKLARKRAQHEEFARTGARE